MTGPVSHSAFRTSIALLLATSALGAAHAADPAPAVPAADTGGEIIVTATKRAESLQNVPISMQALGSEMLEQHQVQSLDDYVKLLPSVSYQSFGPSQSQIYFRGIVTGGDGLASGPLPATGLYIDETPVTTIYGSVDLHAYDMARVEALSGPQGTLYGASSLSGTLRLITNKPDTRKTYGGFDVEGNKYGPGGYGGTVEGFINIPLSDRAAVRVVGFYEKDGGYVDNVATVGRTVYNPLTGGYIYNRPYRRTLNTFPFADPDPAYYSTAPLPDDYYPNNAKYAKDNFNDVRTFGGRAALKVDLDDNWTVTPAVIYQNQIAHGSFLYDPRAGYLKVHDFTPDYNKDKWYVASMTIQGKISDWDVIYNGSYFHRTVDNSQDYSYFSVAYDAYAGYNYYKDAAGHDLDPTQIIHGHDLYTKQSHELRVSSPATEPLRLTVGAFMQRQTDHRTADYIIPGLSTASVAFDSPIAGAPADDVFYTNIHRVDRDYAMFAEVGYDILPHLTINAGIRGFIANNSLLGFSGGSSSLDRQINLFGCQGTTAQQCPNVDKHYIQAGETHKINLTWKIDRDRMVYFTYSTGFRPGGNNRDAFALGKLQSIPPYKADTLTNYEIGWKTSWFDRKLRINGALFWEEWSDVQYSEPGILGIFYTVNAGSARSRGVEGDFSWSATRHLTLSGSGTYADAKLTSDFCDTVNGCDPANGGQVLAPKGTRLPVNPRFKVNGTARYDFALGTARSFVQATVNHQSGTTQYLTTDGENVLGPTKGFTTFDFSVGASFGAYTISAFIQNAFDKQGVLSKNSSCAIAAPVYCGYYARDYPIKPQFFGLKGGMKF